MTIVSGHQPLYLPWLGYIHKLSLCDVFVYMDDVQFIDRDFIQRNKILSPDGNILLLSVPINRKNSASMKIGDIQISTSGEDWQNKHLKSIRASYGKTPFFARYFPFFQFLYQDNTWTSLSALNFEILKAILKWFRLNPQIIIASKYNFTGKKSDLILEHGIRFNANMVVTGEQGENYINREAFAKKNIKLYHQHYNHPVYQQGRFYGVSHLSFIDLLFRYGDEALEIAYSNNITRADLCKL